MCFLLYSESSFLLIRCWWLHTVKGRKIRLGFPFTDLPLKSRETQFFKKRKKKYSVKEDISLKEDLKRKKIETPYLSELAKANPWFPQNVLYFFCMSLTQLPVRMSLKCLLENLLSQSEDCWVTPTGLHSDCDHEASQLLSRKQVLGQLQHGPLPWAFYHPSMELLWQKHDLSS